MHKTTDRYSRPSAIKISLIAACAGFAAAPLMPARPSLAQAPSGERRWLESPSVPSYSHKRVALVMGNTHYGGANALKNPENDARSIAHTLQALGFDVYMCLDQTAAQMAEDVTTFGSKAEGANVALIYFSGHGAQVDGENFLIPIGFNGHSEGDIKYTAFNANRIFDSLAAAKSRINIVILDACRDNPFTNTTRSLTRGLAPIDAPGGTLISYATAPGETAEDNPSSANGLFTQELLRRMKTPSIQIEEVFKGTRKAVREASSGKQVPWEESSLEDTFFFVPPLDNKVKPLPSPFDAKPVPPPIFNAFKLLTPEIVQTQPEFTGLRAVFNDCISDAKAATESLSDPVEKARSLWGICTAKAAMGDLSGAKGIAAGIGEAVWKTSAYRDIAVIQAHKGDIPGAKFTLSEAKSSSNLIESETEKVTGLCQLAAVLTHVGDTSDAKAAVMNAKSIAQNISNARDRNMALASVVAGQAQTGDVVDALAVARGIPGFEQAANALASIALVQFQKGDIAGARASLSSAVTAAKSMRRNPYPQSELLCRIASLQARVGDIAAARATLADAKTIVQASGNAQWCQFTFHSIANSLADAGDLAGARETANLSDQNWRTHSLGTIAAAQAKAGDIPGAKETAESIHEAIRKTFAFCDIAAAQSRLGDLEEAKQSLAYAKTAVTRVPDDNYLPTILARIACEQVRAGDIPGATVTMMEARASIAPPARVKLRSLKFSRIVVQFFESLRPDAKERAGEIH